MEPAQRASARMPTVTTIVEPVLALDARAVIGECPVWDDRTGTLCWIDTRPGLVHRFSPADRADRVMEIGQPLGAVALAAQGGLIVAMEAGFGLIPAGAAGPQRVIEVERDIGGRRVNDGRCDGAGRFWAGSMAWDRTVGAGTLYRLEAVGGALVPSPVLGGITIANGIDWSPDGTLMYYVDSPTQRIDVFDFDVHAGTLANRRGFAAIAQQDGLPDGLVVDADGGVWLALFGGSCVRRYLPSGRVDREVRLPVSGVTSAGFGGRDLTDLYITSASLDLATGRPTLPAPAGGIFVCRPGPRGKPANRFRWI